MLLVSCATKTVYVTPEIPTYPIELPSKPVLSSVVLDDSIPAPLIDNYLSLVEYALKLEAVLVGDGKDNSGVLGYIEQVNEILKGE